MWRKGFGGVGLAVVELSSQKLNHSKIDKVIDDVLRLCSATKKHDIYLISVITVTQSSPLLYLLTYSVFKKNHYKVVHVIYLRSKLSIIHETCPYSLMKAP